MPVDGQCRVPGCKELGLYFVRLDKHLKRCHAGKTRQENFHYPIPRHQGRVLTGKDREHCPCSVRGCQYYGVLMSRLERHMKKAHKELVDSSRPKFLPKFPVNCEFSSDEEKDDSPSAALIEEIIKSL